MERAETQHPSSRGVKHASEYKFVEWAQGISSRNFDVVHMSGILAARKRGDLLGLDVGGGVGKFAAELAKTVGDCRVIVIDNSKLAKAHAVDDARIQFEEADFFHYRTDRRFDFVIFKTVLHHFIGRDDRETVENQRRALLKARELLTDDGVLLIEENFYEGLFGSDVTGRLIYEVTRLTFLERVTRAMGANTAGEGVRFRSRESWFRALDEAGFKVDSFTRSDSWGEHWPWWQKAPLFAHERFQAIIAASVRD